MIIHNTEILEGQRAVVKIPVGELPSGNRINIHAHIFRSKEPGPCILLLGGVHGDEINGVEIIRRALVGRFFDNLQRGSVIAIPLLNIYGFIHFSRDVPDGKDVNRSFPGNAAGSLASRVARLITKKILPHINFGIDFHTGGRHYYNYPQIRYSAEDPFAETLARAFGTPVIVAAKPLGKSLRKTAQEMGKTILTFEGGESLRYDGFSIEHALGGLRRLLASQHMLPAEDGPIASPLSFKQSGWVRAPRAGLFLWSKCAGHPVVEGEPLGEINDPFGHSSYTIYAPHGGYIIGHNNAPVINQGDALFHIAYQGANGLDDSEE